MSVQVVPNQTELREYLSKGLTQQQIVDAWEEKTNVRVSRSAIGMAIERYGLKSAHQRPRHEDLLPWKVRAEHRMAYDARMLRLEGRIRKNLPISEEEAKMLASWKRQLNDQNAVVHYDPDTEQGFFWIDRDTAESPDPTGLIERPAGPAKRKGS